MWFLKFFLFWKCLLLMRNLESKTDGEKLEDFFVNITIQLYRVFFYGKFWTTLCKISWIYVSWSHSYDTYFEMFDPRKCDELVFWITSKVVKIEPSYWMEKKQNFIRIIWKYPYNYQMNGLNPYRTPHINTSELWNAFISSDSDFDDHVWFCFHLKRSKVIKMEIFL